MATAADLIPHRYNRVHVLLLSWERGDLRMFDQLCELQEVFDVFYNYEVEEWKIPVTNPHHSLTSKILEFLANNDGIGNLLILYYAGHGGITNERDSVWTCVDDPESPEVVEWSSVQTLLLLDTVSDILILIDCCKAASSVRKSRVRQYGLVEVIAACGFDRDAPLTGEETFTANLVAQLKEVGIKNNRVESIHNDLLNRLKRFDRVNALTNTVPAIYYGLADPIEDRSIHLVKLPSRTTRRKKHPRTRDIVEAPPKGPSGDNQSHKTSNSRSIQPSTVGPPQVLLARTPEASQIEASLEIGRNPQPELNKDKSLEELFLRTLSFESTNDRFDGLLPPHEKTFGWILDEADKPHCDFVQWISHETDLYWISGKAGSGKSTLMNLIYRDPRTFQFLRRWAGTRPLTIAQFFFWNSGSVLQRSLEGLKRSLLHQILTEQPALVSTVMNKVFGAYINSFPIIGLTIQQLTLAFRIAVEEFSRTACLCLFIDGLDEYGGDDSDDLDIMAMVRLVRELALIPNVKACVSSRPEHGIQTTLAGFPSLRLQDLTFLDIQQFVQSSLYEGALLRNSDGREHELQELIREIVQKLDGVFLWASLVVKSLRRHLHQSESISFLNEKVAELPSELGGLYHQMLGRIKPIDRQRASEIFQILRASQAQLVDRMSDEISEPVFTTIGLHYALQYPQEAAIQAAHASLTKSIQTR